MQRKKIYSIGWGYNHSRSTPLKALFLHPCCPWEPAAIVHDASWAESADGIAVMSSADFLRIAREARERNAPLTACLQLQEPTQRQIWLRRAGEAGFDLLDDGQILREAASAMTTQDQQCDIGVARLPDAFDDAVAAELAALAPAWSDAGSARVFAAYLLFLQTGLLSSFERVLTRPAPHPLAADGNRFLKNHVAAQRHGLAWEIADRRSNFLEQACLLAGRRWSYALSAADEQTAQSQLAKLRAATATLPLAISGSVGGADGRQSPIAGAAPADFAGRHCVARIDVDEPAQWAGVLIRETASCGLSVTLGRRPRQLLRLLQRLQDFPAGELRLSCSRPGPLGLVLEWSNAALSD